MYLVFISMPSEKYRGQLRSLLLYLCYSNAHQAWGGVGGGGGGGGVLYILLLLLILLCFYVSHFSA